MAKGKETSDDRQQRGPGQAAIPQAAQHGLGAADDLARGRMPMGPARDRLGRLAKAIGKLAYEAQDFADEIDEDAGIWLWCLSGATHDKPTADATATM